MFYVVVLLILTIRPICQQQHEFGFQTNDQSENIRDRNHLLNCYCIIVHLSTFVIVIVNDPNSWCT